MALVLPPRGESGCSSKVRAAHLLSILNLPESDQLSALSGDSGVLSASSRLVSSIDTISPMTRDAEIFGRIAVAHAFNDLHACAAKPTDACVSFGLDPASIESGDGAALIRSVKSVLDRGKVRLCKAHTYMSQATQVTLSVVGVQNHPLRRMRKGGEYALVLSKPLGAATASHYSWLSENKTIVASSGNIMLADHSSLVGQIERLCFSGTTDISGFGLLGHVAILAHAQKCEVALNFSALPFIEGLEELVATFPINCAAERNEEDFDDLCEWQWEASSEDRRKLYNAETSGPLLCIVDKGSTDSFLAILRKKGFLHSEKIGTVKRSFTPIVRVV